MIPLLGFGVEKFFGTANQTQERIYEDADKGIDLVTFATVQRMHSRSGRLDGGLVMREDEHSHEQI